MQITNRFTHIKAPGYGIKSNELTRWLEEQFLEAHMNARETMWFNQERQKPIPRRSLWRKLPQWWSNLAVRSRKVKSRKYFLPWDGPYVVLEKTSDAHYKISKTGSCIKWQIIVHYNRLKLVKEEPDQLKIFARPSLGKRQPTAIGDLEETANQGLFSENTTRWNVCQNTEKPRNAWRYQRMEEEDDFSHNQF